MNLVECDGCEEQERASIAALEMWWALRRRAHTGEKQRRDLCRNCFDKAIKYLRTENAPKG